MPVEYYEESLQIIVLEGSFTFENIKDVDLFRVSKEKIAEHWDTIEEIPAKTQWKNNNGKF